MKAQRRWWRWYDQEGKWEQERSWGWRVDWQIIWSISVVVVRWGVLVQDSDPCPATSSLSTSPVIADDVSRFACDNRNTKTDHHKTISRLTSGGSTITHSLQTRVQEADNPSNDERN